jgi:hypothetical protein
MPLQYKKGLKLMKMFIIIGMLMININIYASHIIRTPPTKDMTFLERHDYTRRLENVTHEYIQDKLEPSQILLLFVFFVLGSGSVVILCTKYEWGLPERKG